MDVAAHAVVRNATPFRTRDELAGHGVEALEQMRERGARRLFHCEHLHLDIVDIEVAAVAVHGAIRHEVVNVGVVFERGCIGFVRRVVHETPEEPERVGLS